MYFLDSCQVNEGGCDLNAICSHNTTTNAVICTCKAGYTNSGSQSTVVCKGKILLIEKKKETRRILKNSQSLQIAV